MNWIESKLTQKINQTLKIKLGMVYINYYFIQMIIILLYIYHTLEEKIPITFWISFQKMIIIRQIQLISNF